METKTRRPVKVVAYARYSSHSQTEQSIEGQLRDIHEYANRNGYIIVNEYIDRAFSGTSDKRPAFQQMIQDSGKRQFSLVLVWKLDRFARDRCDSAVYKMVLKKNGVSLVSVMENIGDTPESVILESVIEGMAEYYSRNLSENIKRGQRESILKGWFPGGPIPYGYLHEDHRLVPNPKLVPVVREIFDRYAHGEKNAAIIRDLNERGVKSKHGHALDMNVIPNMVNNTVYIGEFRYNDSVVEGCADPIVERGIFEMAAARLKHNKRAPASSRKPAVVYHLLGKIFCGECGKRMVGDGGVSKTGKYHCYYICSARKKSSKSCGNLRVRKDEIEYIICRVISDFLMDKNRHVLEIMAKEIETIYNTGYEKEELKQLEARQREIIRDLEKLVDSLITMPEAARPRIGARIEELEKQREELDISIAKKSMECCDVFTKDDFLKYLKLTMLDLDKEENRLFIIEKFLDRAYLYHDGRLVIYLAWLGGHPHAYDPDDPGPGEKGYEDGKLIFDGSIPEGLASLPDFQKGSTLISYAPPYADKVEPRLPHVFFLRGRLGVVVWLEDLR